MTYLLDTNALIWWLADPSRLSPEARTVIENPVTRVLCSSISSVEITIKIGKGKLSIDSPLRQAITDAQLELLPFTHAHADKYGSLPLLHKDPFDRMLIAQALVEGATFITSDGELAGYGVPILKTWSRD